MPEMQRGGIHRVRLDAAGRMREKSASANSKHSAHFFQEQDIRFAALKDSALYFMAKEIFRRKAF
jgi:hypothetical protein